MILLDYIQLSSYAKKIKKSRQWVYELMKNNKLKPPAVKIDKTYFVHKSTKIIK